MTRLEYELWAYDMDLWDACDEVEDVLDLYGHIRTRVLLEIADYWGVFPEDIQYELDLR